MIKKKIKKKDNVINFPSKLSSVEKEIEAIVFAAAEPLDILTIENKISKKTDVEKILLKSYSTILMTKDFQKINIPRLPVFTTEDGIKTIREFFGKLLDWKKLDDLIPKNFKDEKKFKKTGTAGIFAGSLELVKEGNLEIKQKDLFEDVYIKKIK